MKTIFNFMSRPIASQRPGPAPCAVRYLRAVPKEKPWWKRAADPPSTPPLSTPPLSTPPLSTPPLSTPPTATDDDEGDDDGDGDAPAAAGPALASAPAAHRDLADGETTTMAGSGAAPYVLRNVGGVYSCSCPAWRNQGAAIERRTCKHLRALRGDAAETARTGGPPPPRRASGTSSTASPANAGATPAAIAPPILLAHAWDHVTDLSGWWMSEKLDGVRAYWDGESFISRLGNRFAAPAWFAAGLPSTPLDGELWAGRKQFQRAVSIARRQDGSDAWRELTYVVFDAPGHDATFEARLDFVRAHVESARPPHARWHPHDRCRDLDHLRAELARVEALGGEGLMLRQPGSRYEVGRSWTLRKVKTFHDAEARVIGHERGAGKHRGRLGALVCQLPDGTTFNVGTGLSDAERAAPPPIGAIITYRYQELSNDGVPRFPSYVGVRDDVAWPPAGASSAPSPSPPSPAPAPAPAPAPRFDGDRLLRTFTRGAERWSVELAGRAVTVDADGVITVRRSDTAAGAWRDAERLIAAQLGHGFTELR
jgi:DNA ligase-1